MTPAPWSETGTAFKEACRMFADGKTHLAVAADLNFPANITLAWQKRWLKEREGEMSEFKVGDRVCDPNSPGDEGTIMEAPAIPGRLFVVRWDAGYFGSHGQDELCKGPAKPAFKRGDFVRVPHDPGEIGTIIACHGETCDVKWPDTAGICEICTEDLELVSSPEHSSDHSHYFKPCPFDTVDVYRVLTLFAVTDPCIQHAVKKLLVAGGRGGGKPIDKDIQEAIESLVRWQGMRREEGGKA